MHRFSGLVLGLLALGCTPLDLTTTDAGLGDGGIPAVDAGPIDAGPPRAIYAVPREGVETAFFDTPWPTDLRVTAEGTVDLSEFPNPRRSTLLADFLQAATASQQGFSTNGAVYFRFSRALDPRSFASTIEQSVASEASVFLVDVDPDSPERGERHPAVLSFRETPTFWWPSGTLAIRPADGFPLRGGTTYAAVVTRAVRSISGETLMRDADLDAVLGEGGDADVQRARALLVDAREVLSEQGIDDDDLLSITVFTTQDPTREARVIRDWMRSSFEAPTARADAWMYSRVRPEHHELVGRYGPVPVFQEGTIPYVSDGGLIRLDADGAPTVHSTYDARFALSIPRTAMPEAGWPLVIYSHGTGGDYQTFIGEGLAAALGSIGVAVMGIDQIHHGERNPLGGSPDTLFFNLSNPDSVRWNNVQSALDVVQQARMAAALEVPDAVLGGGARIDPTRIYFVGHSQGGLVGPLFLGIDDAVGGGVVSAGGGLIGYALTQKREPIDIPPLVATALGVRSLEVEGVDLMHPVITVLQGWLDPSDPVNYAALAFAEPREGFAPKSVLSTEGLMDVYTPPVSIEALAIAFRQPPVAPLSQPNPGWDYLGLSALAPPVSGNVAGGLASAGLLQFPMDGHFAIFRNDTAKAQVIGFIASLVEGTPTIVAP